MICPILDNDKGFLICPCTGERPFVVFSGDAVYNYLVTEEYHAVDLSQMNIVLESGAREVLESKESV